jgi:hypothetical protein
MNLEQVCADLRLLTPGQRKVVYRITGGVEVSATRTDRICPQDFAVGLVLPGREEFNPTHVRLLFNLYLQRTSDSAAFSQVLAGFESLYDGNDPEVVASHLSELSFRLELDSVETELCYGQLLMVEQEFNYGPMGCKKGKVEPPREFLARFIRWVGSGSDEIDRIIGAAVRNYPPPTKFARKP